jgi:hypothetical protein
MGVSAGFWWVLGHQSLGHADVTTCALIAWRLSAVAGSRFRGCPGRSGREPSNAGAGKTHSRSFGGVLVAVTGRGSCLPTPQVELV